MCKKRITVTAQPILVLTILYTSFTNMKILLLFLLATFVAAESQADIPNPIRLPFAIGDLNCLSWRLTVETNNRGYFATVPTDCVSHIADYMLGSQYRADLNYLAGVAYEYARNVTLKEDGNDIWIFDIGDTTLSSLPYYERPEVNFGATKYNSTAYKEWLLEGKAPAVPSIIYLYRKLLRLGFKIVFLSGKGEDLRDVTEKNLKKAGFTTWEKVILREPYEDTLAFKSKKREELVAQGYRIRGNMGDQWKDLQGNNAGERTLKVPNPMYYVS